MSDIIDPFEEEETEDWYEVVHELIVERVTRVYAKNELEAIEQAELGSGEVFLEDITGSTLLNVSEPF